MTEAEASATEAGAETAAPVDETAGAEAPAEEAVAASKARKGKAKAKAEAPTTEAAEEVEIPF